MLKFRCSFCAKKIAVTGDFAGKVVKCPRCGSPTKVPRTALEESALVMDAAGISPAAANPLESAVPLEESALPEKPALKKKVAPLKKAALPEKLCPQCGFTVANDTEFCVTCGYQLEPQGDVSELVGAAVATESVRVIPRLPFAIFGSFAGAMLGAVIWAAIVYFTGFEFGIVAWGVGVLAGLGAIVFASERGVLLGVIAAGMAVLGLFAGKLLCIYWVVLPEAARIVIEAQDEQINQVMKEPHFMFVMGCVKMVEDEKFSKEYSHLLIRAETTGEILEDKQDEIQRDRQAVLDFLDTWPAPEKKAFIKAKLKENAEVLTQKIKETVSYIDFLKESMSYWDILWFILAVGSAFKLGYGWGQ